MVAVCFVMNHMAKKGRNPCFVFARGHDGAQAKYVETWLHVEADACSMVQESATCGTWRYSQRAG